RDGRRMQREDFQESLKESALRFLTDSVDEVEIELVVPEVVGALNRAAQLVQSDFGAVDGLKGLRIPGLHATAQAVEAEAAHERKGLRPQIAGQKFKSAPAARVEPEVSIQLAQQLLQLRLRENVRRP